MRKRKRKLDFTRLSSDVDFPKAMAEHQVAYGIITSTLSNKQYNKQYGEMAWRVETAAQYMSEGLGKKWKERVIWSSTRPLSLPFTGS